MADTRVVTLKKEKDTKNTIKFQEVEVEGQPQVIGTLYLQKWALPKDCQQVKITVEPM